MISLFFIVMGIIGTLVILAYPKIIRLVIILFIGYLSLAYSWYFAILYIPLLLLIIHFKRRKRNG